MSVTLEALAAETGWLRQLARSLVNDTVAAEDLAHDAYVIAAERPPSDAPLKPWLVRVMTNLTRMRRRGDLRRGTRERAVAELAGAPPAPDELVERLELHRMLAGLVLELPQASRDLVLLTFFEGMSSSAVGKRLGIPASTVRRRLKQALGELRAKLDEKKPRKAWMAALAGFGWPRKAAAGLPWLVAAGIVLAVGAGWLVRELHAPAAHAAAKTTYTSASAVAQLMKEPVAAHKDLTLRAAGLAPQALEQSVVVGRVLDERGAAVADADILVHCPLGDPWDNPDAGMTRTRSRGDGLFAIPHQPGCWPTVIARKADRGGLAFLDEDGADGIVEPQLRPTLPVTLHVVDDATGAPLVDASVEGMAALSPIDRATTDRNGDAQVRLLGVMEDPSRPDPDRLFVHFAAEHPDFTSGAAMVTSRRALANPVVIRLRRGIVARGQVRGPDEQPIAHARISFGGVPRDGATRPHAPRAVYADDEGRFELHFGRAGSYAVYAGTAELMSTRADEAQLVVPPAGRDDVVLHVEPRTNAGVEGVVVDARGAPVAGATVMAAGSSLAPVTTDARGAFAFRVASARLQLVARAGALASEYTPVEIVRGKATHVTLRAEAAGITGVVVDGDGHSIAHAQVWLNQVERGGQAVIAGQRFFTDDNGAFSIDVPRGDVRLSVRRGFDDDFLDADDRWVAGGSRDVKLVLP